MTFFIISYVCGSNAISLSLFFFFLAKVSDESCPSHYFLFIKNKIRNEGYKIFNTLLHNLFKG